MNARAAVASAVLLGLAACSQPATPASAPPPSASPVTPAAAPLTPKGLGPLAIGMTDAQARAAVGPANIEADTGTEISETCTEIKLQGEYDGVYLMIEEGKLSRISATEDSPVRTDKGVGLGARPADVMAAYPNAMSEPHKYEDAPAAYLTAWTVPGQEGTVFEVNSQGVVGSINAGGPSIQYVEGCA
jgi:hypothetical protein